MRQNEYVKLEFTMRKAVKVLRLSESGYENGFNIGKANRESLRGFLDLYGKIETWRRYAKEVWKVPSAAEVLEKWVQEDLFRHAERAYEKRINAVPDLSRYPELRGMKEYIQDELKGTAEGANLSIKEIIFSHFWYDVYQLLKGHAKWLENVGAGCTTVVFRKTDVGPIIGRNTDDSVDWVQKQSYGDYFPSIVLRPRSMGYSSGPLGNEKGLVMMGSSIDYPSEGEPDELFPVEVGDLVMRHCAKVEEALEMFKRYNMFTRRCSNIALVDAEGDAAVVEKSWRHIGIIRAKGETVFTTDGVAVHPETRSLLDTSSELYTFNYRRWLNLERLTKDAASKPTVDAMWQILRDHSSPSPVCKHLDRLPPFYRLITLFSAVYIPKEKRYYVTLAEPGPTYPCSLEPVEFKYDTPW